MDKHDLDDFTKDLDSTFDGLTTKKSTPSKIVEPVKNVDLVEIQLSQIETAKKEKQEKKLRTVGWVASSISFIGILLNAYKLILCWPVWCVANIFWIYWAYKKKEWSQVFLWIVFTLGNLYGWFLWATM